MNLMVIVLAAAGCLSAPERSGSLNLTPRAEGFAQYMEGVVLLRRGQFEEAAVAFEQAAKGMPDSVKLHRDMVRLYVHLEEPEKALDAAEHAAELEPDSAEILFTLGLLNGRLERHEEAADAYKRALDLEPNNPELYRRIMQAEERTNDLVAVLEMGERLIELVPDSPLLPALYLQQGLNLVRAGDGEAALEVTQKALELDPGLDNARFLLGVIYLDLDDAEKAAFELKQYCETSPDDLQGKQNYAAALGRLGRYTEAAGVLAEAQTQADAPNPRHAIQRQYLLLRAGDAAAASDVVPPNGAPIFGTFMRAVSRQRMGEDYRPLLDNLDEIEGDIDLETQEFLIGTMVSFGMEDTGAFFAEAVKAFLDAGVHSKYLDTIHARVLMAQDQDDTAAEVLLAALDRFGADKWLHYYLAHIYDRQDRVDDAEHHLKECLRIDPQDADIMNFLGYMYAEHDVKLDDAEKLLTQALAMDPDNGFYLDSLGWIYYRKGDADRAIELIRRALLEMDGDDAVLRDHLGDAYLLNGEADKALAEWRRAQRLDPELEGVAEKIDAHTE